MKDSSLSVWSTRQTVFQLIFFSKQNNPSQSATDKPTSRDDNKNTNELFSKIWCTSEYVRFGTQDYGNTSWDVSSKFFALGAISFLSVNIKLFAPSATKSQ